MIGSTSSERFYPAAGNCARRDDGSTARDNGRLAFTLHPAALRRARPRGHVQLPRMRRSGMGPGAAAALRGPANARRSGWHGQAALRARAGGLQQDFYFIDRGRSRGMVAEGMQAFVAYLNRSLKIRKPNEYVHVVAVAVARDQLVCWSTSTAPIRRSTRSTGLCLRSRPITLAPPGSRHCDATRSRRASIPAAGSKRRASDRAACRP